MGYLDYAGLQYLWGKLKEKFAPKSHTHDDRYYTETEINTKLNGKAPNEHTHQYLSLYGTRPANINFTKSTNGTGAMFHFVATSSTTTGKPPDDSSILQLNWDNNGGWDSQLALSTTASPHVYYRNQQNGTWGNWSTLLDNLNYTDYAAKKEHTHTKSQITDFPSSLKNPTALTIQTNGAIAATYDGSAAKTVNITKGTIGLSNVDNTADKDKSVKYATSAANATNTQYLSNDSQYMRFHWNGQSGQPSWLWGGSDASNMYVYNPSNFSVNYANSAGTTLDAPYTITYEGTYTGTGERTGSASSPIRHTLSKSYDLVYFIKNLKGRYTPGLIDLFSQGNYGKQYVAMNMLPTTFTLIIDLSPNRIIMYNGGSNYSTSGQWGNMNYIRRNGNSIEFYSTYSNNNEDYFFNDAYTSYSIFGFNLNHSLFHYDV